MLPMPKAAHHYHTGCHDKHNHLQCGSNLGPLAPQSDALITRPLWPVVLLLVYFYVLCEDNTYCRMTNRELPHWLVEMQSSDIHHYRMMNVSVVDRASLQWCTVTWPCIIFEWCMVTSKWSHDRAPLQVELISVNLWCVITVFIIKKAILSKS